MLCTTNFVSFACLDCILLIIPLCVKVRGQESEKKGGMHYMEVKQLLLQSFCQAITFYLLLKSEGLPVRDHPVVARLVEIKSLLDKVFFLLSFVVNLIFYMRCPIDLKIWFSRWHIILPDGVHKICSCSSSSL